MATVADVAQLLETLEDSSLYWQAGSLPLPSTGRPMNVLGRLNAFWNNVACSVTWNKPTRNNQNVFSHAEKVCAEHLSSQGLSAADLLGPRIITTHKAMHPSNVLPFAEHRDWRGRLWAAEAIDVPEYLDAPSLRKQDWPMDLGRLEIPLHLNPEHEQNLEEAIGKGMGELMWFPVVASWAKTSRYHYFGAYGDKPRVELRSKNHRSSKHHLLGHFGGTKPPPWSGHAEPYTDLACALLVLLVYEVIQVDHEVIVTSAPLPDEQSGSAAAIEDAGPSTLLGAAFTTSQQSSVPKSAMVRLTIRLKQQERCKFLDNTSGLLTGRLELCVLIHYLLKEGLGSGLTVGPDCDGYLNQGMHDVEDADDPLQDALQDAGLSIAQAKLAHERRKKRWGKKEDPPLPAAAKLRMMKAGALESNAPQADCPAALSSVPKLFQLQALDWMLKREETGDARGKGHLSLHPGYLQFITPAGHALHLQRSGTFRFTFNLPTCPISQTCGGLLCDEMGLGKTLEVLMLVLARPPSPDWAIAELPKKRPGTRALQEEKKDKYSKDTESGNNKLPIKTTLIIVPAGLRQQWADEIKAHLQEDAMTWDVLPALDSAMLGKAGPSGGRDAKTGRSQRRTTTKQREEESDDQDVVPIICENGTPMHTCDVVLATYEQLQKELISAGEKSPLLQFGFWRLVLDEAQTVASTHTAAAESVSTLWRRYAWICTGTPMSSKTRDLGGLLKFLAYKPFCHEREWDVIVRLMPGWVGAIRQILHRVMLSRSHADVAEEAALPPCIHENRWLQFSPSQQRSYNAMLADAWKAIAARNHYPYYRYQAFNPMRYFTTLRQMCCDPSEVKQDDSLMGPSEHLSMTDLLERLTLKSFREYDSVAQRLVTTRMVLAAVLWNSGSKEAGLQEFENVRRELQHGKERATCVELASLMSRTGSQGELLSEPRRTAHASTQGPDSQAQEVPGPSAGPSEEATPAKPGANRGKAAGAKRKAASEEG
ncbi:hypothetical protein WJX73_003162 [Symbiochloris irregularis]|uniref:Helicase ATP-binding domain-containing protein n=1 Tax=Symbiochloris irregularis TaxID=706552 RepID=A0AAW1PBJ0_9CHLO